MNIKVSRKIWISAGVTLVLLALSLLVSTALAQEPGDGFVLDPAGGSPTSTMTYQGYLENNGQPANGVYDFRVSVWNQSTGGTLFGSIMVYDSPGVTVQDGYFTIYFLPGIPVNQVFDGGDRWLQLEVRPHNWGGYTILPRQPITNVPYAWSLRPGAVISSTPTTWDGWVVKVNMSSAYPAANAMLGTTATGSAVAGLSPGGKGVYGQTEDGYAIYGHDGGSIQARGYGGYFYSLNGIGVYGRSNALPIHPNLYSPGVYGRSTHGSGVYGVNEYATAWTSAGVTGESTDAYGVRGYSTNKHGVYGLSSGGAGAGVYGYNDNWVGTYGQGRWGVVGDATGTGTYGGYFYDNVYITGKLDVGGAVDPIIAERFPADPEQDYEGGDILCLDGASPYVQLCTEGNDTKVIGVAVPGPDIEDGEILIAIMGYQAAQPQAGPRALDSSPPRMVMVIKVDASYGPIQRGDLLTSSPTPGYAMKAEPVDIDGVQFYRPGTIVGKAMESLSEGQGLIEVFVTLQ